MRRSSNPRLHFRHHDSPDSTPYRVCCHVVDVCINQELLGAITENRQLPGDGIIVRLHWEAKEQFSGKSLSTITLSQGDGTKSTLSPQYALAVATKTDILDKFAGDMLDTYDAKLVAVRYPPFSLTFHHSVDFEVSMFTSEKYKLYGILKKFLSECVPSGNRIQLSFRINKGSKVRLPESDICRCLIPSKEKILQNDSQRGDVVSTSDASCQTVATTHFMSGTSNRHDKRNTENNTHRIIVERFAAFEKELTDQRNFIESQLGEQRKQNQEMKVLLLEITEAITKKSTENAALRSKGTSANLLKDDLNLMQFSLECDEQMKSSTTSETRKKENHAGSEHIESDGNNDDDDEDDDDDDEDDDGDIDDDEEEEEVGEEEEEEDDDPDASDEKKINDDNEEDQTTSEEEESGGGKKNGKTEERIDQQSRKGPILKEVVGSELRSLSPGRTKAEIKHMTAKEKRSSLNQFSRNLNDPQGQLSHGRESRPRSRPADMTRQTLYSLAQALGQYDENLGSDLNGELWYDSYQTKDGKLDTVTRSKTQICPHGKYVTTQTTDAALTKPDGTVETATLLANQFGNVDELGMEGMMFDSPKVRGNAYSDLQSTEINFDIDTKLPTSDRGSAMTKTRLSDEEGGDERFKMLIDCMIGDNPNRDRLWESVDDVLSEEPSVPYVDAVLDTVICLDTSDSVNDETFQGMKNSVMDFINAVEDIAEQHELEENIALVTFGGRAKIVHHLSNDYGSLRDALDEITPGGPSPMLEGVLVSMACLNKGGELNIQNYVKMPPRLIIITDGLATGELLESAGDNKYGIDEKQKVLLENAFETLRKRQPGDYQHGQIIFVPVGRSNMSFLLSLAKACDGSLIERSNLKKLCKHQRFHKLAGDAMERMSHKNFESTKLMYGAVTLNVELGPDVETDERGDVRDIVQENLDKVIVQYGNIYKFDNIHETSGLPPLGSRVTRGQDWIWGNQDTEGAGTILNHGLDGHCLWILWDNTLCNIYRYGKNDCYDVQLVSDQPREPNKIDFSVGLQVERGPNWHVLYGNQDGGPGNRGVIIREKPEQRRVMVRWQNGNMYEYRNGENNMFDLTVLDPLTLLMESTTKA